MSLFNGPVSKLAPSSSPVTTPSKSLVPPASPSIQPAKNEQAVAQNNTVATLTAEGQSLFTLFALRGSGGNQKAVLSAQVESPKNAVKNFNDSRESALTELTKNNFIFS